MIFLTRFKKCADGVFSTLSDDNVPLAVTLEHAYLQDDGSYAPKIPEGQYTCLFGQHELHSGPIETFEITCVPGHSGLLFHPGNVNGDSEGCVLTGETATATSITNSRATWEKLMARWGTDNFILQVQ